MLALAPPIQHTTTDCSLRPSSAASSSSSRPARPASRKSHTYSLPLQSSSSASATVSNSAASRPAASGDSSSPHHAVPQRTPSVQSAQPSHTQREDEDPPPPPEANSNGSGRVVRPSSPNVDIYQVDAQTLLHLLATALDQIAHLNDGRPHADPHMLSNLQARSNFAPTSVDSPLWQSLTSASRFALQTSSSLTFHARNIPTIPLEAYLLRIHKYCPASNEVFLSLLVYFDRMTRLAKEACGRVFAVDSYNIHRLVIAGVTVASKFFSDVFYTNSRYAKVGGLPLPELNQLELQFLYLNDFRLRISNDEMQYYANALVRQTRIPPDVSIAPFLPQSPALLDPHERPPIGPRFYFAAVDGYLAQGSDEAEHSIHSPHSRTPSPVRPTDYRRSTSSYSTSSTSDAASEAGTETDVDGSTDDEPTIRAPHSSSSETTSVHSATSDADSIYTDDGDRSRDSYDGSSRDYRMMSP